MGNFENPWGQGSRHYDRWMGGNPWEGQNHPNGLQGQEDQLDEDNGDKNTPGNYVVFGTDYAIDPVISSVYYDAKRQKGWKILIAKNCTDLAKKLKGKQVNNLFIVSHGNVSASSFKIGDQTIDSTPSGLAQLKPLESISATHVILFSCMVGRHKNLDNSTIDFGGATVLGSVASTFSAFVYGNQGWSYPSESKTRNMSELSLFNKAGKKATFVISGLKPSEGNRFNEADQWRRAYFEGAGIWTQCDPTGNLADIRHALYFTDDGQFHFTEYDWREHKYVKPYLDYFYQITSDLGMTHCDDGWGAIFGSPHYYKDPDDENQDDN